MDLGLRGRVVVVCGGSRGIGFAAANDFVREGATVVICGRDEESLRSAASRLGQSVMTIAADLATTDGIATLVREVNAAHDRVDVLVTNTGGPSTCAALDADWPAWQRASELLLRSAVELCRAFVPGMRTRGWGRVVGITSFAVKRPVPNLVLSNSLRAGVTGFFRTLADEVARDGVTVNTVLPGYTDTERLQGLADAATQRSGGTRDDVYRRYRDEAPAARLGTPEELAAVIAFLASDRAGFVTGQAICVDGGAIRSLL